MDHIHLLLLHKEVTPGIIILTLDLIIVEDSAIEGEWPLKAFAWTIVVTHVVNDLVSHDQHSGSKSAHS